MATENKQTAPATLTGDEDFWKSMCRFLADEHNALVPWLNKRHTTEEEKAAIVVRLDIIKAALTEANAALAKIATQEALHTA